MVPLLSGLFGSNSKQRRHFVAIDIGSNTAIRSLLMERTAQGLATLKKHSFELPVRERQTDLIAPVSEYLRNLLFQYLRTIGRAPDQTILGLGNYFTFNEVATVARARREPASAISPAELQEILDEFLEEHREKIRAEASYTIAHLMPFRMSVDGYPVNALSRHTRGRTIEVTMLATYVLIPYWEALSRLRTTLGGLAIEFVSNHAAVAAAAVSSLKVQSALIVKIGSRVTEISILWDGAIRSATQFRIGGDDFTDAIARRLGFAHADAERMKRQLESTLLPGKTKAATLEAIRIVAERWVGELAGVLRKEDRFLLPERVFLIGGGARLGVVAETLRTRRWYGELTFFEHLEIEVLKAEALLAPRMAAAPLKLSGPEEVALAALVLRLA